MQPLTLIIHRTSYLLRLHFNPPDQIYLGIVLVSAGLALFPIEQPFQGASAGRVSTPPKNRGPRSNRHQVGFLIGKNGINFLDELVGQLLNLLLTLAVLVL